MSSTVSEKLTSRLLMIVLVVSLGTRLPMGYSFAVLNAPQRIIVSWFRAVKCERCPDVNSSYCLPDDEEPVAVTLANDLSLRTIWALSSSIFLFGGLASTAFNGLLIHSFGFRKCLCMYGVTHIVGYLVSYAAYSTSLYELLIVGRFIIGVSAGMDSAITTAYMAEITPAKFRGLTATIPLITFGMGGIVASVCSLPAALGSTGRWPYLMIVPLLPIIVMCLFLPVCPESPKWQFLMKDDRAAAQRTLKWLREKDDVSSEMGALEAELGKQSKKLGIRQLFRDPRLRPTLFICMAAMFAQQWSGMGCMRSYSTSIINAMGVSHVNSVWLSTGLWMVLTTTLILCMLLIDRAGRRTLLLTSQYVMIVSLSLFVTFLVLNANGYGWAKYATITFTFVFLCGFAMGSSSIPWILPAEMFKQESRTAACTVSTIVHWSSTCVTTLAFPFLVAVLEEYTFLIFLAAVLVPTVYLHYRLPETKGKTINEIQLMLDARHFGVTAEMTAL